MQQIALLASQRLAHADARSQTKCFCAQSKGGKQLRQIDRGGCAYKGPAKILHPGIKPERVEGRLIPVDSLPLSKSRATARARLLVVIFTKKIPVHIIKRVLVATNSAQVQVVQKSNHHALRVDGCFSGRPSSL